MEIIDYVDYELAMKLCNSGFNLKVGTYYNSKKKFKSSKILPCSNFNNSRNGNISAPSLYEAKKWIFQKYGKFIQTTLNFRGKINVYIETKTTLSSIKENGTIKNFETEQEALNAGILEALNKKA